MFNLEIGSGLLAFIIFEIVMIVTVLIATKRLSEEETL